MELATGAMGNLLPKLAEMVKEEYHLQAGVRKKVEALSRELESMHAVLHKVGEVPPDQLDEQVRIWASDLREASYDMEDIVDAFLVGVDGQHHEPADSNMLKRLGAKISNMFKKIKDRHKIAGAIKHINDKLEEVSKRHGRYKLYDIASKSSPNSIDPRILDLFKVTQLVGIDDTMDKIIKNLLSESEEGDNKTKAMSIVGFGGLGKTTLAKAIYDKLKPGFHCGAFIPVGQNPDLQKVLKDILFGLDKVEYNDIHNRTWDERQFIEELRDFLENKRYFIVVDDIWEAQSWEIIKCALGNSDGSKIIATTRIIEVATKVGDAYNLEPLSDYYSKMLFNTRIFGGDGRGLHNQLDEAQYNIILKKCGGVPLAIITLASLLAGKPLENWSDVYNSIGFDHQDNDVTHNTNRILSFSYYDLPPHLKTCLLYLSLYPEDYFIPKKFLIWKWIAEGFINVEPGIRLYEVGERYFNELMNRSMILLEEDEEECFIRGCRVHDMVLGLIRSLSKGENFVTILDSEKEEKTHIVNARRLTVQNRVVEKNPHATLGMQQVRSFIATMSYINFLPQLPSFKSLRVLAIEGCSSREGGYNFEHLGNLVQLRYLGLTKTPTRELPKEIGRHLKFLQVLYLDKTGIEELPSSMGLLKQLVCLGSDEKTRVPDWIGNLTTLQELWMYTGDDEESARKFVKDLGNLRELRELHTRINLVDEGMEGDLMESLGNLDKIQVMEIMGKPLEKAAKWEAGFVSPQHLRSLRLQVLMFSRVPVWMNSSLLPNLSHLFIVSLVLPDRDMETLGRLPQLLSLQVISRDTRLVSIKKKSTTTGGGGETDDSLYFQKLRILHLKGFSFRFDLIIMPRLEDIEFSVQMMYLKNADLLGFDKLGSWAKLPSLKRVQATINCWGVRAAEVEEAEAAFAHASAVHPNRPTLVLKRICEGSMLSPDQEPVIFTQKVIDDIVNVREEKDKEGYFHFCRLLNFPFLEKFIVSINCENATIEEVEEAEAALTYAAEVHPNHLTLEITRLRQDKIITQQLTADPNPGKRKRGQSCPSV